MTSCCLAEAGLHLNAESKQRMQVSKLAIGHTKLKLPPPRDFDADTHMQTVDKGQVLTDREDKQPNAV